LIFAPSCKFSTHLTLFFFIITTNMANISGFQTLSSRGETAAKVTFPMALDVISDLFSVESNPAGFVSLGLAENVRTDS
jgi:hypothetical protein